MPDEVGIIYNKEIILFVGAGFHSRLLSFCVAVRSIDAIAAGVVI
jgi:hypothetical protein